ncbi:MAG: hypothetical protein HUJ60_00420 [Bacilli bacterium]|nr:hypothetical protein [Bacilli bacterium]
MAYNSEYVKRRKRRNNALVFGSIALALLIAITVVAFLGRVSGQFSVRLADQYATQLQMFTRGEIDDEGILTPTDTTTYLNAAGVEEANLIAADTLPTSDILDAANQVGLPGDKSGLDPKKDMAVGAHNGYDQFESAEGAVVTRELYLAYTFYVRNLNPDVATYAVSLSYDYTETAHNEDDVAAKSTTSIISIARVRVFENAWSSLGSTHECTTYALPRATADEDGSFQERISDVHVRDATGDHRVEPVQEVNRGYCTNFQSNNFVFTAIRTLPANSIVRYTVVCWLEGTDSDCRGFPPVGSTLSLSMNINGAGETSEDKSNSSGSGTSSSSLATEDGSSDSSI